MVIWRDGNVTHQSLDNVIPLIKQRHQAHACASSVDVQGFFVEAARDLGIYIGD